MADARPLFSVSGQQFIIGLGVITLWAIVLGALLFRAVPDQNRDAFNLFLGAVIGAGTTVLGFYFPSSIGARSKDEAITKLTDAVAASTPPSTTTTTTTTGTPAGTKP